ncbi:MAG: endolytic transglycosylase MltG [Candidatus Aquicultorales bacterium]
MGSVLSLVVIFAVIAIIAMPTIQAINSPPPKEVKSTGKEIPVIVKKGWTAADIADELEKKKVVQSAMIFRFYIKYNEIGEKLRPGEYIMREGMSYGEAASILLKGPPEIFVTVTIPEGFTIDQEAEVLAKELGIDPDYFKTLAKQGSSQFATAFTFLAQNKTATLEGYLFPDTYRFKPKTTAEDVIEVQLRQFEKVIEELGVEAKGKNVHDVVTAASLIEREARVGDERPLISAVIANRLTKGMLLQIDATVQYALPKWKKELTYDDLKVESPYNTYLHAGLPPGPISAPGKDCLQAALEPADVDYLYYVVKDEEGRHFFTSDYAEFERAKERQP